MESTFKNIRPVSWSQQDTSPCLICDFMQHFLLLIALLLFFSPRYDYVSTHPSVVMYLEKRKIMQNFCETEAFALMKFGQSWLFQKLSRIFNAYIFMVSALIIIIF